MYLYLRGQAFNFIFFTRISVAITFFHFLSYLPTHASCSFAERIFLLLQRFLGDCFQREPAPESSTGLSSVSGGSLEQQVTLPRTWPVTATDTHGFISLQSATALWAWGSSSCSPSNQSSDWPCQSFAVTYYHKVNFLQRGRASNSGTDGNTEYF